MPNLIQNRRVVLLRRRGGNPRYILPATGNDANDGRTAATAWASEVPANAALAVVNNGITHLRIDTSGAPLYLATTLAIGPNARGIVVEGATPGVKADLRAYKVLSNAAFTQPDAVTYPNLWQTTDTQVRSVLWERGGSNAYDLIWYDKKLAANAAAAKPLVNGTAGSCWTDGTTMYFRPLTGNDPVSDGKEYVRSYVYNTGSGHGMNVTTTAQIQNLMIGGSCVAGMNDPNDIIGAYALNVSGGAGTTVVRNCYFYYGGKHTLGLITGVSGSSVLVEDVRIEQGSPYVGVGGQTPLVSYTEQTQTGLTHTYRRLSCTSNAGLVGSMAGTKIDNYAFFTTHTDNSGVNPIQYESILFEDCELAGLYVLLGGSHIRAGGAILRSSRVGSVSGPGVLVDRCRLNAGLAYNSTTSDTITLRNSLIIPEQSPDSAQAKWRVRGTVTWENCTIDMSQTPGGYSGTLLFSSPSVSTTRFTYRNNVFLGAGRCFPFTSLASLHVLSMDYNIYTNLIADQRIVAFPDFTSPPVTSNSDTLAEWQVRGFDTHSMNTNPLLNADYTPTASSPARNLAVTALTEDYIGAIVPRVTSGAYEYRA